MESDMVKTVGIDGIISGVAKCYGVTTREILGESRIKSLVEPRKIASYLIKKHTFLTYEDIGSYMNRTHATIIYHCKEIEREINDSPQMAETLASVERHIFGK